MQISIIIIIIISLSVWPRAESGVSGAAEFMVLSINGSEYHHAGAWEHREAHFPLNSVSWKDGSRCPEIPGC